MTLGVRSLSGWSWRQFVPGVLLGASPPVQGYHLVPADAGLADGAYLPVGPRLQPLVQAGPTEQVPAEAHNGVFGRVQADVALEVSILARPSVALLVARGRRGTLWVFRSCHHAGTDLLDCFHFGSNGAGGSNFTQGLRFT